MGVSTTTELQVRGKEIDQVELGIYGLTDGTSVNAVPAPLGPGQTGDDPDNDGGSDEGGTDEAQTGAMVALFLPADVALRLSLDGSEFPPSAGVQRVLEPEDLHLTLAYLSNDFTQLKSKKGAILSAIIDFAASQPQAGLTGSINGLGRFFGDAGDDPTLAGPQAFYASFDCPDLPTFRAELVDALPIEADKKHGFTPHITLCYLDPSASDDELEVAKTEITFTEITLAWGDERITLPLGGSTGNAGRSKTGSGSSSNSKPNLQSNHRIANMSEAEFDEVGQDETDREGLIAEAKRLGRPFVEKLPASWGVTMSEAEEALWGPDADKLTWQEIGKLCDMVLNGLEVEVNPGPATFDDQAAAPSQSQAPAAGSPYGALKGEVIKGNLARGAHGHFVNVANAGASGPDGPNKPGATGGVGKEGDAAVDALRQQRKVTVGNTVFAAFADGSPHGNAMAELMSELFTQGQVPGDLSQIKPEYGDMLVKRGLAGIVTDPLTGQSGYTLSQNGKLLLQASVLGDVKAATAARKAAAKAAGFVEPKVTKGKAPAKPKAPKAPAAPKSTAPKATPKPKVAPAPKAAPTPKAPAVPKLPTPKAPAVPKAPATPKTPAPKATPKPKAPAAPKAPKAPVGPKQLSPKAAINQAFQDGTAAGSIRANLLGSVLATAASNGDLPGFSAAHGQLLLSMGLAKQTGTDAKGNPIYHLSENGQKLVAAALKGDVAGIQAAIKAAKPAA